MAKSASLLLVGPREQLTEDIPAWVTLTVACSPNKDLKCSCRLGPWRFVYGNSGWHRASHREHSPGSRWQDAATTWSPLPLL